ncbi:MAG TPA: hypothetical protein VJW23_01745 [Propionibacteriaceae bacterium]|nr:hypothetical protein [Propionibacteriaceae bacterium]
MPAIRALRTTSARDSDGKRFDEAKIKKMTGGDILAGRFMRQDYFNFYPSHLILVLSNFLPAVREGGTRMVMGTSP